MVGQAGDQSTTGHATLQRQVSQQSQGSVDQVDNARTQNVPGHAPPNNLDLTSRMNSNVTATTNATESAAPLTQPGDGEAPQSNRGSFDYYAAATSQSSQVLMLSRN